MWLQNGEGSSRGRKSSRNGLVAVAIDKDKGSQKAIKWAIENLLSRGQAIILIHVIPRPSTAPRGGKRPLAGLDGADVSVLEKPTRDLLVTFHCFCTRKDILCFDVVLEDTNIAKAISEYTASSAIESLVLGASRASRHGFISEKTVDIPTSVCKVSPNFCTVYVVSKSKISSVRNASCQAPFTSPLSPVLQKMQEQLNSNFNPIRSGTRFGGMSSISEYSTASLYNEEVEAELRRLKLELQKSIDMYNTACREAMTAKEKTVELHQWPKEEEKRLEDARMAEEAEKSEAEHKKAKHKTEVETAEAAKRVAEIESQKQVTETSHEIIRAKI